MQLSASGTTVLVEEPNWGRFLGLIAAFGAAIAVREVVVKLIHRHPDDDDDRGGEGGRAESDEGPP